jgi:hypothetical protein
MSKIKKFVLPTLHRVFGGLIANKMVKIQPLSAPMGNIFYGPGYEGKNAYEDVRECGGINVFLASKIIDANYRPQYPFINTGASSSRRRHFSRQSAVDVIYFIGKLI